ncbi:hypothetical protein [Paenibacillus sp. FSL R7-0331]|uniref:hypothetical protein n=1 Tax=Paenibacillus sp. FSL R7-0331 TaxID=1536773 RepID=UPI0004F6ED70|nr:hypothetical protein [Paenibacillus sp. FSL R7-0331]AIQ50697.1 hypothetical protein R70331_03515 [Paenibacillus sp. FSL R7-0331]
MKNTLIGSVFLFCGTIVCLAIIILATNFLPSVDTYKGTKIWFAIFGASGYKSYSLNLGIPFTIGLIFVVLGTIVLIKELVGNYLIKN